MNRRTVSIMVSMAAFCSIIGPANYASAQGLRPAPMRAATSDTATQADPTTVPAGKKLNKNKRLQQMITELGLTDDQVVKVKGILSDQQSKMRKVKADTSLSPDAKREQYQAIRKESRKQLAAVLDRDQLKKLREMRKNRDVAKQQDTPTTAAQ